MSNRGSVEVKKSEGVECARLPVQEIERKWIVSELPQNIANWRGKEILQGYIVADPNGPEVRIRQKGDRYFQTIKSDGVLVRLEGEVELTKEQFDVLWPFTEGRRIEKTRYAVDTDEGRIELDVYKGALEGLIIAEVEFESTRASSQFTPPSWFGQEVTDDRRYKNKNLALQARLPQE